jgi:hydrogenase nickel incorporation protein HypA/HybF
MHEYALAQDIINTICEEVTDDLKKITLINIEVGAYSGIVVDSLDFGLRLILTEKKNPHADINIIQVPTIARCECGKKYEINNLYENCPACQSFNRKIISGMEIIINSVEIRESS